MLARLLLLLIFCTGPLPAQENRKLIPATVASISSEEIAGFDTYAPDIQKLIEDALALTRQNLGYFYGSADPAQKGMDCSGTVYYLLRRAGVKDVPRSSAEQYGWVMEKGVFTAVQADSLDGPEFANLQPGDLLFWKGTYASTKNLPASHAMIYLGKAKSDGKPLMVGASDGRSYRGKKCYGVSVFDFRLPPKGSKSQFIGYSRIPGLQPAAE